MTESSGEYPRTFECSVAGRELALVIGNCACVLFRTQQEVDYLAVDIIEDNEEQTLRVFNNTSLIRWMAGYRLKRHEGNMMRPLVLNFKDVPSSFRELTGWNPAVIEREMPSESELEMFLDVNAGRIDQEWGAM